jgi:endonuclease YncB( thermonuclease family)
MPSNVYKFRRTKWADPKRFETKPKPRGSRYFSGLIVLCTLIGFVAVQAWSKLSTEPKVTPSAPSSSARTSISVHVIDGDTISLNDGRPNVRLVGFNAPETGNRARCEAERQKGEAAQRRLREIVSNGRPDFQQVACSCGTLRVNGVDVGATLIGEGLAVRFACGATSCPTLPRPWC